MTGGKFIRQCAVMCGLVFLSFTASGKDAPAASPVATTDAGKVAGVSSDGIFVFRGIPYARPPIGALRWRAPQPAAPWKNVRDAGKFGFACPQDTSNPKLDILKMGGAPAPTSEDCLTLNVWTPALTKKRAPVMVWIHGGAGRLGAGSLPYYDGASFARDGVVLVTVNYRLGHLGSFAYPGLAEEAVQKGEYTGSYALMDQIAALNWVKRNIANFGGDPGNVTIFGESSGGVSVFYLLESPPARGLFQKAIIESAGGWFGPLPDADSAIKRGKEIAAAAGAPNATLNQLRNLPAWKITSVPGNSAAAPDAALVPESPTIAIASGRYAKVPLIIGINDGEDSLINREIAKAVAQIDDKTLDKLRKLYGANIDREMAARYKFRDEVGTAPARWVAAHWAAPAYLYRFQHVTESYRPARQRATHGAEIFYVFKTLGREPDVASKPQPADEELADRIHARWVAFAKSGNPNGIGMTHWPVYAKDTDQWMVFGQNRTSVQAHVLKPQLDYYESSIAWVIFYFQVKAEIARFFRWL